MCTCDVFAHAITLVSTPQALVWPRPFSFSKLTIRPYILKTILNPNSTPPSWFSIPSRSHRRYAPKPRHSPLSQPHCCLIFGEIILEYDSGCVVVPPCVPPACQVTYGCRRSLQLQCTCLRLENKEGTKVLKGSRYGSLTLCVVSRDWESSEIDIPKHIRWGMRNIL